MSHHVLNIVFDKVFFILGIVQTMGESGLTRQPKTQKLNEELDIVDRNIKCLHNLPEEIL